MYKQYGLFGQTTGVTVVETLLSYDERLKTNYKLYQSLLEKPLEEGVSINLKRSIRTLTYHVPSIKNSFIYPYSNAKTEGIHNKIKVLNRIAYGYRNFNHYRQRIFMHFKLKSASHAS